MRSLCIFRLTPHRFRIALTALTALACAAACWRWSRQQVVIDDSFITFRYARNLVRGYGLVFNPGERVEGYTNFFWVLLSAIPIALRADPFLAMRVFGLLSYFAWIALCGTAFVDPRNQRPVARLLLAASALPVALVPDGLASFAGSGMETHFVALSLLLVGLSQHVWLGRTKTLVVVRALAPLVACLTRLDAVVFVVASVAVVFGESLARRATVRHMASDLARRYGVCALGLASWLLWKWSYYHSILPNTYYAKAGDTAQWRAGIAYLRAFAAGSPYVLVLLPFLLIAATRLADPRPRSFARFAIIGLVLYGVYVAKVGGDFMHYRFMFEVLPVFLWAAFAGLVAVADRIPPVAIAGALLASALSFHHPVVDLVYHQETMEEMNNCCGPGFVRMGKLFGQVLPAGIRFSTTAAGSIPYYADAFVIDQLGLTDEIVARTSGVPRNIRRGHVKRASYDYLRSRGVHLVFGHPIVSACANPAVEPGRANVFVRDGADCIRSWYLTPTPELTSYFCSRPAQFLVTGIACPGTDGHDVTAPPPSRSR